MLFDFEITNVNSKIMKKVFLLVTLVFTSLYSFNQDIAYRIRVKVDADACGSCNHWPIENVFYGYIDNTKIKDIIHEWNYGQYDVWQYIYVTAPIDSQRILRWHDPAEGRWERRVFSPDLTKTQTFAYHGTDGGIAWHSTWMDAEIETYDPVIIDSVKFDAGIKHNYYQCIDDINGDLTFYLSAKHVYNSASLWLYVYDENNTQIDYAYLGNYSSEKTIQFKTLNLQNYFKKQIHFSLRTEIGSTAKLNRSTTDYIFLQPFPDPIDTNIIEPSCFGYDDGSITLTFPESTDISGYRTSISKEGIEVNSMEIKNNVLVFNKNTFPAGSGLKGINAGEYEISIEADAVSCIKWIYINIGEPEQLVLERASAYHPYTWKGKSYDIRGYNGRDTITVEASGGTPPYRFSLNNGTNYTSPTSNNIYNFLSVPANRNDVVRITDYNNCNANTNLPVTLSQPDMISISGFYSDKVSCNIQNSGTHDDGNVEFNIQGGIGPYRIYFNDTLMANNVTEFVQINSRKAIQYDIQVNDLYITDWDTIITVSQPDKLVIDPIAETDKQWPKCVGGDDGSLDVSGSGGFSLDSDNNYKFIITGRSDTVTSVDGIANLGNIEATSYSILIKDANNCTQTITDVLIPQNPHPLTPVLVDTVQPSCNDWNDGVAMFTAINGLPFTSGYTLALKEVTADRFNSYKDRFTYMSEITNDTVVFENLKTGTYEVKVWDQHECEINDYYRDTFFLPQPFPIKIDTVVRQVSRKGLANGYVCAMINGGSGEYEYRWYKGLTVVEATTIKTGTTTDATFIDSLSTGDYIMWVRDMNGCNNGEGDDGWLEWKIKIKEPDKRLNYSIIEHKDISCYSYNNGRLIIEGDGGWGSNYSYKIDMGNWTFGNIFNNLEYGYHTVYVKDALGEIYRDSVFIDQPLPLNASITQNEPARCFGENNGSFMLDISGGIQPYYVSTLENPKRKEGNILDNLKAGAYTIYVTDNNSCTFSLPGIIDQPELLSMTLDTLINTLCGEASGSIVTDCSGGTPAYSLQWSLNDIPIAATAKDIHMLEAGLYRVKITDSKGCVYEPGAFTIISSNGPMLSDTLITPVSCFGYADGIIGVDVVNGTAPYSLSWSNGDEGMEIRDLSAGEYIVTISDINSCLNYASLVMIQPELLTVEVSTINDPQCFGYNNGSIEVTGSGGNGSYNYLWDNGINSSINESLSAGIYSVTITDLLSCSAHSTIELNDPDPVTLYLGGKKTICGGQEVMLDAGDFQTFSWSSDSGFTSSQQVVVVHQAGNYYIEVTDEMGCIGKDTFELITSNDLLQANFLITNEAYMGDTIVAIDISWPLPDSVYWEYDEVYATTISNGYYKSLIFTEPGSYFITLNSKLGDCMDSYTNQINILPKNNPNSTTPDNGPFIKKFVAYPVPNEGTFSVEYELREKTDAVIKLLNDSGLLDQKQINDTEGDLIEYNMTDLPSGLYVLQLFAGNEYKNIKLIIY